VADVILMKQFWFDGDAQFAPIGMLSGGERRRLQLLLTLVQQPNVLLLDVPTNDLDLDTLRALEAFLDDWPGIVIAVSHDRSFLDRVTDELFALDGRGGAAWIRGGVAAWLQQREQPAAARANSGAGHKAAAKPVATAAVKPRPVGGRSPSTVRRQLGQMERDLATAIERRDAVAAELGNAVDHRELGAIGERLARAQAAVDAAEEQWLALADEAEALGLEV
jgi:ATP-binding cassette subfamily F protein uup